MSKKNYVIKEICKRTIRCDFREEFQNSFLEYFPGKSRKWDIRYKKSAIGKVMKNDFESVVNKMREYYGKIKYFDVLKKSVKGVKVEDSCIKVEGLDYEVENIVYNYLKYWENLGYFIIYGFGGRGDEKLKKIIREGGEILVERLMEVNKRELMGLLFWGNIRNNRFKRLEEINDFCEKMGLTSNKKLKVKLFFYEKREKMNRNDIKFMTKKMELEMEEKMKKGNIFWGDNFDESIDMAGLVLNPSNLKYFNEMCWERFLDIEGDGGKLMMIATRNYFVKNIDMMDMERLLIFSSLIFYLYGLRRPTDVDILGYEYPEPEGNLMRIYKEFGTTNKNILGIGELSVRGYGEWKKGGKKEHLSGWFGEQWPQLFGAENMEEMIFNPRFNLQIMGMKVITLDADMERRRIRYRAAAYADLIAYNYYLPISIKIEEPPIKYIVGGEVKKYDTVGKVKDLLRTIKNYLKLRYKLTMSLEEIASELKMGKERTGLEKKEIRTLKDEFLRKRIQMYNRLRSIKKN